MAKKQKDLKRRYGVIYYFTSTNIQEPDAWGSTVTFRKACGNASRHVAESDFSAAEYRRAIIVDKMAGEKGEMVRLYERTADGIKVKDFDWKFSPDDL